MAMAQEYAQEGIRDNIVKAKNHYNRQFQIFTNNFYVMRSALRYFSVNQGMSFTSSKVSKNFPMNVTVAGSCLKILKELDVISARSASSSPDRYMPEDVDMDRLQEVQELLVNNYEIDEF